MDLTTCGFTIIIPLNKLYISKQQGINTPKWETQAVDFFDHKYYNFYSGATIGNSPVPTLLPILCLPISISLPQIDFSTMYFLPSSSGSFAFCISLPFYSFSPCSYHYNCPVTLLVSSPPLSYNFDFWGLFVLFRLSYITFFSLISSMRTNFQEDKRSIVMTSIKCLDF